MTTARTLLTIGAGGFRVLPACRDPEHLILGESREDDIKAALRQLTSKTRQLRRELEELIDHARRDPRTFTHDRSYSLRSARVQDRADDSRKQASKRIRPKPDTRKR